MNDFSVLQPFKSSSYPELLSKAISPSRVTVQFIAWNPLNPPAIPSGACILWLECKELTSSQGNQLNSFGFNNHIASWPLSGTVFDGNQKSISLHNLMISKLSFSLWTNLGEVMVIDSNQLVISLNYSIE
jgi:hypothetical protein